MDWAWSSPAIIVSISLRVVCVWRQQTRPPAEIVVVDASAGWEKTRDEIVTNLASRDPSHSLAICAGRTASLDLAEKSGLQIDEKRIIDTI
jgi:hypothetical protein